MRQIPFEKFHALGNDFIVIDLVRIRITERTKSSLAKNICDRRYGIGADGVVYFSLFRGRFAMRIFNADGGEAELSGNGLRILAHYLVSRGITRKRKFEIYSSVGANLVNIKKKSRQRVISSVYLPQPQFAASEVPIEFDGEYFINLPFECEAGELVGTAVNVGNPHLVFFVDNFDFDWREFGRVAESDQRFPEKCNIEFAQIKSRKRVVHNIWERGAGETSASGSGAAAVVAAGVINGVLNHDVGVHEPAGVLEVSVASLEEPIMISGPSVRVGSGTFDFDANA